MAKAVRGCPDLVIVRPDIARHRQVWSEVFEMYRGVTLLVEPLSLRFEAYLDVTENRLGEPLITTAMKGLQR